MADGLSWGNSSFSEPLSFSEDLLFAGVIFMSIVFCRNGIFLTCLLTILLLAG